MTYKSNAAQAITAIENAALNALEQACYQYIYEPSQAIVPLDESPLQNSGAVTVDGTSVIVSYGVGESAEYAVIQHENLQYSHAPGRQAKYLEQPYRAAINPILSTIQDAIKNI